MRSKLWRWTLQNFELSSGFGKGFIDADDVWQLHLQHTAATVAEAGCLPCLTQQPFGQTKSLQRKLRKLYVTIEDQGHVLHKLAVIMQTRQTQEPNGRTSPQNLSHPSTPDVPPVSSTSPPHLCYKNEPKCHQPDQPDLRKRQMAQQKAFGATSVEGGRHAAEHGITLLVGLDVLLDQIGLILLLGARILANEKTTIHRWQTKIMEVPQ